MMEQQPKPFSYNIPWKSNSVHYGDHRGSQRGLGFEYRGNVPLVDYPDARRMDLRQTLRDPFEQVQVKVFNQDNTTPVFAVCDASSSMQFKGRERKLEKAQAICASIAVSAAEAGDIFSIIAYDNQVIEDLTLPLSHYVHQALEVIAQLESRHTLGMTADGILQVPQFLSQNKGLVFWISDFHMPVALIEQALNMMSQHQVVPVVLWDAMEYRRIPKFGFGTLIDPETGLDRTVFFRAQLRAQFIAAFEERRQMLEDLFLKFESQPLFIEEDFNPDFITHYFEQYMSL